MPGLEPGIQAAPSVVVLWTTALDARVEPAHDERRAMKTTTGLAIAELLR
jgi:hypothetical protein